MVYHLVLSAAVLESEMHLRGLDDHADGNWSALCVFCDEIDVVIAPLNGLLTTSALSDAVSGLFFLMLDPASFHENEIENAVLRTSLAMRSDSYWSHW